MNIFWHTMRIKHSQHFRLEFARQGLGYGSASVRWYMNKNCNKKPGVVITLMRMWVPGSGDLNHCSATTTPTPIPTFTLFNREKLNSNTYLLSSEVIAPLSRSWLYRSGWDSVAFRTSFHVSPCCANFFHLLIFISSKICSTTWTIYLLVSFSSLFTLFPRESNFGIISLSIIQTCPIHLQERDLWGGLGVDGRTILELTLKI